MSENTPGARPVTGAGKGFYCTATAHRTRSGTLLRDLASFSKPFFIASGKVRRTCLLGTPRPPWGVVPQVRGYAVVRSCIKQAAGGDRGGESYPRSFEADMSVIFARSVPFAAGPRSPVTETDADVIFQNIAGPGKTAARR
jgi:hypothetical protein